MAVLVAGCGGSTNHAQSPGTTAATTTTTDTTAGTTAVRAYFLRKGQVWPVGREVPQTQAVAAAALDQLNSGPTSEERGLGLTTALPNGLSFGGLRIADGVATISPSASLARPALAQLVYTLTQFPTVHAVEVDGRRLTRADFKAETPPILVESPLAFETVSSPLRARGTANTFEATFEYDVLGADGKGLAHHFVTATSGSGTRGTFDFSAPFTGSGAGKLVVYEVSAEDGSRIHQIEIPLRLTG